MPDKKFGVMGELILRLAAVMFSPTERNKNESIKK